jgi:glycosyltransferase involved in cell wall biosynthesis
MGLLALSLRAAHGVIFQNDDDMEMFRRTGLVPRATPVTRVFGSGVELDRFATQPVPPGPVTFLLVGRLLRSKGIPEFVAAARSVRREFPDTRFIVVGPADRRGDAISEAELEAWRKEGIAEFVGPVPDVRPYLARCHVFVLPSIGEGVPRSVLEAMAVGRAIITSDTPGCRDTVLQNRSGTLVSYGDSSALAEAMSRFVRDRRYLESAAEESRWLAETRFDARAVSLAIRRAMALA